VCSSVGVSGSWFPRKETSCYSISRGLQVPARSLEAPAVGVSGSWFLRRETSSYSTRSLQVPARRFEAPAVGVSGSWFLRRETSSYNTRRDRQATTLLIRSSCSKMHFIQTPWLVIQCSGKFFDKKLRVPPRLTLGLRNEYFCRPQPSKRQK
jgi:hypothetical protein